MKSFSIDNIIVSKNINILKVADVISNKSDHNMLWAELELLDAALEPNSKKNIALGQTITEKPQLGVTYYGLVDNNINTGVMISAEAQDLTVDLSRIYDLNGISLLFGEKKPASIVIQTSVDNINYINVGNFDVSGDSSYNIEGPAKYVRIKLSAEKGSSYLLNEVQIFGNPQTHSYLAKQLLVDPEFNNFHIDTILEEHNAGWNIASNLTQDTLHLEKIENGLSVAAVQPDNFVRLYQEIKILPNRVYIFQFDIRGIDVKSSEFAFGVDQFSKNVESIKDYKTRMVDNLNIDKEFKTFVYSFTSSAEVDFGIVSLEFLKTTGKFEVKNLKVSEGHRTQQVFIKSSKVILKINETAKLEASILPADANDFNLVWVSSDPSIVKVNENGVITAVGKGEAYISLLSKENLLLESSILIKVD